MARNDRAGGRAADIKLGRQDNAPRPNEGDLDLGAVSRGIGRRKAWIALATLVAFGLSYLFVTVVRPRYTAEAKVLVENGESYFTRPDKETQQQLPTLDAETVESQVQLITSRDLARRAIRKLGLIGNPEFDPLASGLNPVSRVLVMLGLQRDPAKMSAEDRVLETYYERLVVFSVAKTRVLSIQFVSENPDLAARAANEIAALYIQAQEDAKKDSAKAASAWLAPQIEVLRTKVADADAKVEAFRSRSGLLVGTNNTIYTAQQLADLATQLSTARAVSADRAAKAKLIREMMREGRVADVSDVANNELIRTIAQQRVTLRGQLALEERTLLPGHPHIKELTAQLADVDRALRGAAERVARGLENDARVASTRVRELSAVVDAQKDTVATGNGDEVQLRALQRDATSARDQLESFMQKYRAAVARDVANASPADARIISRAVAPQLPSFPKKIPTILIATLAGFFLSLGLVTARELLSQRAAMPVRREPDEMEVERDRRTTPLAVPLPVAADRAATDRAAADPVPSVAAPAYDVAPILHAVTAAKPTGKACCIVVCGVDRETRGSLAAIDIASALGVDARTVAVDFDEGVPGLGSFLGPDETAGLADLVSGHRAFTEVIHRLPNSRVHVMPAGTSADHDPLPAEDEEARLDMILDALVATYDFVVLSAPPLSANDRAAQLARWTEAAVLVTEGNADDAPTAAAAETLRASRGARVSILSLHGRSALRTAA